MKLEGVTEITLERPEYIARPSCGHDYRPMDSQKAHRMFPDMDRWKLDVFECALCGLVSTQKRPAGPETFRKHSADLLSSQIDPREYSDGGPSPLEYSDDLPNHILEPEEPFDLIADVSERLRIILEDIRTHRRRFPYLDKLFQASPTPH